MLMRDVVLIACAAAIGFAGVLVFSMPDKGSSLMSMAFIGMGQGCNIKGNVSIDSGQRIYHVPGQQYYSETVVRPEFGERWFCSEAEARAAGWRKSKV
jgi:hypothetical protein